MIWTFHRLHFILHRHYGLTWPDMKLHLFCFVLAYWDFFSWRSRKEINMYCVFASVLSRMEGKRSWQICIYTCRKSRSNGSKCSHDQTHPHSETTAKMDTLARTIHFSSRQRLQLGFISSPALSGSRVVHHSWMNHLYGLITGSFSAEPTHPPSSALFVQAPLSNWGNFPAAAPISNACPL